MGQAREAVRHVELRKPRKGRKGSKDDAARQARRAARELKKANKIGNRALSEAPEAHKTGTAVGNRREKTEQLRAELANLNEQIDSRKTPKAQKQELKAARAELEGEARRAAALDWLTNIAFAAGARPDVVEVLDKAEIRYVDDAAIASDAAYDDKLNVILVKKSAVEQITKDIESLDRKGVLSIKTGEILNPEKLKGTKEYRQLVLQQALIAHEAAHGQQDHDGYIEEAKILLDDLVGQYDSAPDELKPALGAEIAQTYVGALEYETYLQQELYQFEMGIAPEKTKWMTIDIDPATGHATPKAKAAAVDNILRFLEAGGNPITVEKARAVAESDDDGHGHDGGAAQSQGDTEGKRHGGDTVDGKRHGGDTVDGKRHGGDTVDGKRHGGDTVDGKRHGGDTVDGKRHGGDLLGGIKTDAHQQKSNKDKDAGKSNAAMTNLAIAALTANAKPNG